MICYDTRDDNSSAQHTLVYYFVFGTLASIVVGLFAGLKLSIARYACLSAARILHDKMFVAVDKAVMQLFKTTSLGRIINRFFPEFGVIEMGVKNIVSFFIRFVLLC